MSPPDRLRRVVACAEAGQPLEPTDAAWLAAAATQHLAAPAEVRLDAALGIAPTWGEQGWWVAEARADRDKLLAQIDNELFRSLDITAAARGILSMVHGRRVGVGTEADEAATQMLDALGRTGRGIPGERQLRNLIKRHRGNRTSAHFSGQPIPP